MRVQSIKDLPEKARARVKFGNKKVELDGETFDSKREAEYYQELKLRERLGEVRNIQTKPTYTVIPRQEINGVTIRATYFYPDFLYEELVDGKWVTRADDVKFTTRATAAKQERLKKSTAYQVFQIKRKLLLQQTGIWVREV
jgi:hypothetical protein